MRCVSIGLAVGQKASLEVAVLWRRRARGLPPLALSWGQAWAGSASGGAGFHRHLATPPSNSTARGAVMIAGFGPAPLSAGACAHVQVRWRPQLPRSRGPRTRLGTFFKDARARGFLARPRSGPRCVGPIAEVSRRGGGGGVGGRGGRRTCVLSRRRPWRGPSYQNKFSYP